MDGATATNGGVVGAVYSWLKGICGSRAPRPLEASVRRSTAPSPTLAPAEEDAGNGALGRMSAAAEARAQSVLAWLESSGLLEARARRSVGVVSDEAMALHCGPAGHPEAPARLSEILRQLDASGLARACVAVPSREATEEELKRVHAADFVDRVLHFEATARKKAKAYSFPFGPDTYMNEHTPRAARLAAGSLCGLVDACLDPKQPVRCGMAVVRPPGHHAAHDKAMGFCLFNNVAVGVRHAQQKHGLRRIAVVDWDVHHGNGTSDLFGGDPEVLFFSMHRFDKGFFPGSGFLEDAGKHDARGYTVNVPLEKGFTDHDVCHVMRYVLCPLMERFRPEAIFVSAGFDAVRGDPLGDCRVSIPGFGWMTRCLARLARHYCDEHLFLVLEGGYDPDLIAQCTVECVQSLVSHAAGVPLPRQEHAGAVGDGLAMMSPTPSVPGTPATSAPGTPSISPAPSPSLRSLSFKAFTPASTPEQSPRIAPHPAGGRSVPSSPAISHASEGGGRSRGKPKGPLPRTVRVVHQLTEIHHLLPLKLPVAPDDRPGHAAKNAKKNEARRRKKHGLRSEDHEDHGESSDSSGWAIACGGFDAEPFPGSTPRMVARESLPMPPPLDL